MTETIAFFDFDGTITTKDTLIEFIRYAKGSRKLTLGFVAISPYLVAWKLGIISNQRAKEKLLEHFFKGSSVEEFDRTCESFSREYLPKLLRPAALTELQKLKNKGAAIVIVSASPESWIRYWAQANTFELIASRLLQKEGRLTGRLEGLNCHGEEKVRRIKEKYDLSQFAEVLAYGDSSGDLPMLRLAVNGGSYKPFR